jgi:hypothetical protein
MPDAPLFAFGLALACLAGIRAYLTVFGVGMAALLGWMPLPAGMDVILSPWVLGTAGALAVVEFTADKIPGVDSAWDLVNTLARVPVGAFLASAALSPDGEWGVAAGALGGAAALATHALKSGSRVAINASPEPVSNWVASGTEDVVAVGGLALTLIAPVIAATVLLGLAIVGLFVGWRLFKHFRGSQRSKALSASQV